MAQATFHAGSSNIVFAEAYATSPDLSKLYTAAAPLIPFFNIFIDPATIPSTDYTTASSSAFYFVTPNYWILRTVFAIDTSTLTDNATITSATLNIKAGRAAGSPSANLELWDATFDDSYVPFTYSKIQATDADKRAIYSCKGTNKVSTVPIASLTVAPQADDTTPVSMVLDPASFGVINKTGLSKFVLVVSTDSGQVIPTDLTNFVTINAISYLSGVPVYDIQLVVNYTTGGGTITIPSKPQNVVASKVSDTIGRLNWAVPADDGGGTITGYTITPVNVTDSTQLSPVNVPATPLTRDFPLPTDKQYNFHIYAKNSAGNGQVETSNTITLGTPGGGGPPSGGQVPGPPSNLQGTGLIGSIAIGWNVPTTDGGSTITNYIIEYRESGGSPVTLTIGPVLNYILSGLVNNVTYLIKVAAKNATGIGPYCSEIAVSTTTQTEALELTSWASFNNQLDGGPEHQFSGLTGLSYSSNMTELYNTPTVIYKDLDIKGQVTYRSSKRKLGGYAYDGGGTAYYLPPENNTTGNGIGLAQSLIAYTIGVSYQQPNAGYVSDFMKYSGRPGDAVAYYKKYTGYYADPTVAFSGGDDGKKAAETWKYNVYVNNCTSTSQCMMPGWPFEYIQNRPFLRFDTRKYVPLNEVLSASLSFNVPAGMTVVNQDSITHLEIRTVNRTLVGDNNLIDGNYDDYTTTVVGVIPILNNTALLNGERVAVALSPSAVAINEITKLVLVGSHEATTLPTGWNELTFENVRLNVVIKSGSIQTPGEVEALTATPGDKQITVNWSKPNFTGGSEITAYSIKDMNSSEITTVNVTDPTILTYNKTITGLTNDTLYSYIIFASNAFGEGVALPFSVTPTANRTGPGEVRDFAGVPQDGKVILYWNPPSDKGTMIPPRTLRYIIKNNTTGGKYETYDTSFEIDGLTNGFPYVFQIQAGVSPLAGPGGELIDLYNGPVSTITLTPTDSYTVPGLPNIYSVYAAKGNATVYWIPPAFDGGLPILGWKIKIEAPASHVFKPMLFVVSDPNADSYTIHPLNPDSTYIISVAAFNSAGVGPYDESDPFILLTGTVDNSILVDVDYNYTKFYTAPVELNRGVSTYEDFLYPKEVTEALPATITSDSNTTYPVIISPSNYMLYIHYENPNGFYAPDIMPAGIKIKSTPPVLVTATDYQIPVAPINVQDLFGPGGLKSGGSTQPTFAEWPSAVDIQDIVDYINNYTARYGIPITATITASNRLILTTTPTDNSPIAAGEGVILNFNTSIGQVTSVNELLFGTDPIFSSGTILYNVKNYVPTSEYDKVNKKALIESRVWSFERTRDMSKPSFWVERAEYFKAVDYDINVWDLPILPSTYISATPAEVIPQTNIKPNSVTILYFDDRGKSYALRDYYGDGRLMYRRKVSLGSGETITLEYPKDIVTELDPSNGEDSFGTIDYKTGSITGIVFPTIYEPNSTNIISTFKAATVVGVNVKWPIFVNGVMWLYFVVNGVIRHYQIEPNDPDGITAPKSYVAQNIADMLNAQFRFTNDGLIAGVGSGSQLYVKYTGRPIPEKLYRQHVGPTSTLELLKSDNSYIDPVAGRANSANKLFFGLSPTIIPSSRIYLTYSHTNDDPSPYNYVWYQTPHFVLVSRGVSSQYITKGHLDYLLEKLSYFKPTNTILDNVNFTPVLTDSIKFYDELTVSTADTTEVSPPYIFVSQTPPAPPGSYFVIVENPDGQQNGIIMDADPDPNVRYTYYVPV